MRKRLAALCCAFFLGACSHSAITPDATDLGTPGNWVRGGDSGQVSPDWLDTFADPTLASLVAEAIAGNYSLAQEQARLYEAAQVVTIARADRFPSLDVSLGAARRGIRGSSGERILLESYDADVGLFWDADLWGRLSKQQQAARLSFAAQEARVEAVRRDLAAQTANGYFGAIAAKQLLEVARRRLDNVTQSHEIVSSGYRQGLNDALDLYLARNQVERERASLAQQEQAVAEAVAGLQLALARYPDGRMEMESSLPVLPDPIPVGLPSELLTRRADLQEAWLNLLAADASLAATHKARFPSLSLVGSTGVTSAELSDLLDADLSVWSAAGSLTQPLFNAGELAAREEQARARVQLAEKQYLDQVFRAFADVENAISRSLSLQQRYDAFLDAERNSRAALELALEQYQRGLVTYTTVLESQRQAFDAEATVVELRNQLLQNRINLYLALGGELPGGQTR
ncbi:MAG: efflux transporter outer membrane subunit [Gammaproteobacteria bacterium]|nr:efflux transporter outer membrane subunit [Gammaproteobacteria bacterium]